MKKLSLGNYSAREYSAREYSGSLLTLKPMVLAAIGLSLILIATGCSSSSTVAPFSNPNSQALLLAEGPAIYSFGSQLIDSQTTANFTIVNSGSVTATQMQGSLTISAFQFTGGSYPGTKGTCGNSLAPQTQCTVSVIFNPLYTSAFSDLVTISYNNGSGNSLLSSPQITGAGVLGSSGTADITFNGTGEQTIAISSGANEATGVVVNADRSILLAGYTTFGAQADFALATLEADGSTDLSFGSQGMTTTDFAGMNDQANALAVQTNGMILAAGSVTIGGVSEFGIARYSAGGILDPSFGTLGRASTSISSGASMANAMVIQGDTNIVVAGNTFNGTYTIAALARYLPSGALDSSFGSSGIVTSNFGYNNSIQAVTWESDNKIIAAGYASTGGNDEFLVARYNSNGSLDTTFGSSGFVYIDFGATDHAASVVLQSNGNIVVAGSSVSTSGSQVAVTRLLPTGAIDTSFGNSGKVLFSPTASGGAAKSVLLDFNNNIVFAGSCSNGVNQEFLVGRLLPSGVLDTSFGSAGLAIEPFGTGNAMALSLYQQTSGKLVAAGYATVGTTPNFAVLRLWP